VVEVAHANTERVARRVEHAGSSPPEPVLQEDADGRARIPEHDVVAAVAVHVSDRHRLRTLRIGAERLVLDGGFERAGGVLPEDEHLVVVGFVEVVRRRQDHVVATVAGHVAYGDRLRPGSDGVALIRLEESGACCGRAKPAAAASGGGSSRRMVGPLGSSRIDTSGRRPLQVGSWAVVPGAGLGLIGEADVAETRRSSSVQSKSVAIATATPRCSWPCPFPENVVLPPVRLEPARAHARATIGSPDTGFGPKLRVFEHVEPSLASAGLLRDSGLRFRGPSSGRPLLKDTMEGTGDGRAPTFPNRHTALAWISLGVLPAAERDLSSLVVDRHPEEVGRSQSRVRGRGPSRDG